MKDNCSFVKLNLAESGPEKLNVTESPSGSETEIVVTFVAPSSTVRLANSWSSGTCSGAGALLSFLSPTESLCLFGIKAGLNTSLRVVESRVLCGDSGALGMQNAEASGDK